MTKSLIPALFVFLVAGAPAQVTVSVKPRTAGLTFTQMQQFTKTVSGTTNTSVRWTVDGITGGNSTVGTISTSGLYTPPHALGPHTVRAISLADTSKSAAGKVIMTNYSGVFTWHNNNSRNGLNPQERVLTPSNVKSSTFGKLFSRSVDGQIYAQPLYVANLTIPNRGPRNVVFVATEHDSVYAFDADGKSTSPIWKRSFIDPANGITTAQSSAIPETNITPEIGITGTPTIDGAGKTLYVVAKTVESGTYVQRLHALDTATGTEKTGSPVLITGSFPGVGFGSVNGVIPFDSAASRYAIQRAGLALSNGVVYVAFALHLDRNGFHGWVMGYDATTLAQRFIFCDTPDVHVNTSKDGKGGIWMGAAAPSADGTNIFVVSGNGSFNVDTGGRDYGDSVMKLSSGGSVNDYFTPFEEESLQINDKDLGSTGAVLVPGQTSAHPGGLIVLGGKNGKLYLLDHNYLGQHQSASDSQIVQSMTMGTGVFSTPAVLNSTFYLVGASDVLKAFHMSNNLLPSTPTAKAATTYSFPGATPTISANGSSNGIVWTLQRISGANAVLHANLASNVATELYNSNQAGSRDLPGTSIKFAVPTVANGKVFVGTSSKLTVYGLLP
jgi:hypothetical protein